MYKMKIENESEIEVDKAVVDEEVVGMNTISQPKEHKGRICLWADLSVNDLDELFNTWASTKTVKDMLMKIFDIDDDQQNVKSEILLDLYYYTLQFAKDNNFTTEQSSAFFSMVKKTHEICIETPFDNFDLCFKFFKESLLCHAVRRPPYSLDLFTTEQIRSISEYVVSTYFRHYKMYKYAFTPEVKLDLTMKYTGMPITPPASEAGDLAEETETAERVDGNEEANEANENEDKEPVVEESADAKQLRSMIKQHLEDEIKKLRISMEDHLKTTEESLSKKLNVSEGGKSGKAGRGSAKGKKGK